ncbi:Aldehyde/histidinol dehydrogenase [Trichoderma velutinum]
MAFTSGSSVLLKSIPYQFKDVSLLDSRAYIGGKWLPAESGATFPIFDPVDNAPIFRVANLTATEVHKAIHAAQTAFLTYKKFSHRKRRQLLHQWITIVKENRDDLAAICTLELGKPITESYVTVDYGLSFLEWFEGEIERLYGETIPAARENNRIFTTREPQGVVAAITPWNSPIAMILRKVGAAIAAGCTVVLKPAPETPMCAIAIAKLFERVGYPAGTLNIVTGDAASSPSIGSEMCCNKLVRHLSFTGSTAVGKFLNGECGKSLKKTSMELGGNAPFIVFEDADIQKAVDGLISSKFRSSGQTCVCANRVFVHRSIMSEFAEKLHATQKKIFVYGSVWDPKVNFGPLYSSSGLEKVQRHLEDALANGATLFNKTSIAENQGPNFFPPTILLNCNTETMRFGSEETFGPLAPLVPFDSEEEVLTEALDTGMVGVRVGLVSACEQPFGGFKESGIGREGSKFGVEDYTNVKSITYHYTSPEIANAPNGTHKVDANTIYRVASVTKVFTVLTGLLELNDSDWNRPLTEILPPLKKFTKKNNGDRDPVYTVEWDKVTPNALAAQIAGVPRDGFPDTNDLGFKAIIQSIAGVPLNPDPVKLGLPPISQNNTFEKMFDEDIFEPLDMTSSSSVTPPKSEWHRSVIPGDISNFDVESGIYITSGAVLSTINDMAKLGVGILNSTLLPSDQTRRWLKPFSHTADLRQSVGRPWEIHRYTHPSGVITDLYTKSGDSGDYSAYFVLLPDYDAGFTILSSSSQVTRFLTLSALMDIIINSVIPSLATQAAAEAEHRFTGLYYSEDCSLNSSLTLTVNQSATAAPGLVVSSWISNGTDVLKSLAPTTGPGPWRLLPSISDSAHGKMAFRFVTDLDAPKISSATENKLFTDFPLADWSLRGGD